MLPPLPRCGGWASSSLVSPNRISLPRYDGQVGPHDNLFEVCTAFTCVAACTLALPPIRDTLSEGFSHFVSSMTAPVASGGSEFAGWGFHPLESAAFSRRTSKAVSLPWSICRPLHLRDRTILGFGFSGGVEMRCDSSVRPLRCFSWLLRLHLHGIRPSLKVEGHFASSSEATKIYPGARLIIL